MIVCSGVASSTQQSPVMGHAILKKKKKKKKKNHILAGLPRGRLSLTVCRQDGQTVFVCGPEFLDRPTGWPEETVPLMLYNDTCATNEHI